MFNIKKRFFKRELKRAIADVWADDFAIFTTRQEREVLREALVKARSAQHEIEERMKANPKDKKLAQDGQLVQRRAEAFEKEIEQIDILLDGKEPKADEPYGSRVSGLTERLEGRARKVERIKQYIKNNC